MKRFGYAIRIGGDAEISGALAAGMERGTGVPYPPFGVLPHCGGEAFGPREPYPPLTRVLPHCGGEALRPRAEEAFGPRAEEAFGPRAKEALGPRVKEALGTRAKEGLRRVAMYQHSPEEWAEMIEDARVVYGGQRATPKALQWLVVGYAVICTTIERCYRYMSAWNREG